MQDSIIKGTGNSRYLKSAIGADVTWEQFRELLRAGTLPIDLNGVNAGGFQVLGNALNKASLLKDTTAAQFGLADTAVPNDVLSWVGKYNEYWWSLLHSEASSYTEYSREETGVSANTKLLHGQELGNSVCFSISYSDAVSCDEDGVHLVNPTTKTYTNVVSTRSDAQTLLYTLKNDLMSLPIPCYLTISTYPDTIYLPAGSTVDFETYTSYNATLAFSISDDDGDFYVIAYLGYYPQLFVPAQIVTLKSQIINIPAGETTYEHSTDRNAYPDSGTVDEITYQYLGVPFENAVHPSHIETGSYVGTGVFPRTLSFESAPKVVFIHIASDDDDSAYIVVPAEQFRTAGYSSSDKINEVTYSNGNAVLSWTNSSENTYAGLNAARKTYYYAAIF